MTTAVTLDIPADDHTNLNDPLLQLSAAIVDDLESVRIANENRLRSLTRAAIDVDGEERGFGLPYDHPDVLALGSLVSGLQNSENYAIKHLQRRMRLSPLWPWVNAQRGIGAKQMARLLAAVGDPFVRPEMTNKDTGEVQPSRPRMVSELWAYCGMHLLDVDAEGNVLEPDQMGLAVARVAPFRRRGVKSNWSPDARTRIRLIADSCMKQPSGSKWRDVYEFGRLKYADATHKSKCVRCGPKGSAALPGSPLSAAHQDARARRLVAKGILKELWVVSGQLHGVDTEAFLQQFEQAS